ncbi:MAG: hypothetical protein LUP93_04350, partial [Methanomicrobiales archaeon]|nr:hypothetical protein [Methanomicrobiales archaeon]
MVPKHIGLCALMLAVTLACASPVAAEAIAVSGGTGGFIPSQHADRFTVAWESPSPGDHVLDR